MGTHPVIDELVMETPSIGHSFTTPQDFVAFCERMRGTGGAEEELARQVQLLEWQLLFDHCYRKAVGS